MAKQSDLVVPLGTTSEQSSSTISNHWPAVRSKFLCCCRGEDPMLSRDQFWNRRNRELKESHLYDLMNITGQGRAVDVYKTEGEYMLRSLLRDELPQFLYNGGKGKRINFHELQKLASSRYYNKLLDEKQYKVCKKINTCFENADNYECNHLSDIQVCWDIHKRGLFGETLLHICLMHTTPDHVAITRVLIEEFPGLTVDIFIGVEYFGLNPVHQGVLNDDHELLQMIVSNGGSVHDRATGYFFMPVKRVRKLQADESGGINDNDYSGFSYYGELPLAFAACLGDQEAYDYLIENGSDPNMPDTFGNNVLHMVVINNQLEMFRIALRHHKKPADPSITNRCGLTPIALSAKLGRQGVFNEIISLNTVELWKFSNWTCAVYPLRGLDTIGPDGKTDWNSALMHIVNGESNAHLDMLDGGVINQLLEEKWRAYARRRFLERLLYALFQLLVLSIAIYLRPDSSQFVFSNTKATNIVAVIRYTCEIVSIINGIVALSVIFDEMREQGLMGYLKTCRHAPPKVGYFIGCVMIIMCLPMRLITYFDPYPSGKAIGRQIEESLLILALPLMWFYLLFFAGGIILTGPFITMIWKMIRGDMVRFAFIYIVILVAFAQAYYFLFRDLDIASIATFKTLQGTIMTLFQMTLGEFKVSKGDYLIKYDEFQYTRYVVVTKIVFILFMILVPILLLNMLIAMMGNTYQTVISKSEKEWRSMWAKILLSLERTYSPDRLLKFRESYSISFPANDVERGLVVISTTKKNQAKRRRTAVANWKRSFRKVLELVRKHHRSGNKTPFRLSSKLNQQPNRKQSLSDGSNNSNRQCLRRILQRMESSQFTRTVSRVALGDDDDDNIGLPVPNSIALSALADMPIAVGDTSSGGSGSSGFSTSTGVTFANSTPNSVDSYDGPVSAKPNNNRKLSTHKGLVRVHNSPALRRLGHTTTFNDSSSQVRSRTSVVKVKASDFEKPSPDKKKNKEVESRSSTGSLSSLLNNMTDY